MREILFRGKRVDNGEWVEGVPTKDAHGEMVIVESLFECEEYLCCGANAYYVDENSIGQFTGLTDKNGKKIFEGDILECKRIDDGITVRVLICIGKYVDYNSDDKNIGVYALLNDGATVGVNDIFEHQDMFEVIGNMHDNPELLEVEE